MCKRALDNRFLSLGNPNRVWAISAIHANIDRLIDLHDSLFERIAPGDRIVYLGNYTGYGDNAAETIDELLTFRRLIMAQQGMKADDLLYLRGGQEEMLHRLLQLQFSPNPVDTLLWMLGNGMNKTLESYDIDPHKGVIVAHEGTVSLTKWTQEIRDKLRAHSGHDTFMTVCRRAVYTAQDDNFPTLFVNAGINPELPLEHQEDNLWWSDKNFNEFQESYHPFNKVVRGYDPNHKGLHLNGVTASLDGGCGFGGSLIGAGMNAQGDVFELMEA